MRNNICISDMGHPKAVNDFIRCITDGMSKGYRDFMVDFSGVGASYPNAIVPISGIIDYLRVSMDIDFEINNISGYLLNSSFVNPLAVSDNGNMITTTPLNKIWKFEDSEGIHNLVDAIVNEVARTLVCGKGVLEGLNWCLNEVMDNVLQHSKANKVT